jgi:hypothetical protein
MVRFWPFAGQGALATKRIRRLRRATFTTAGVLIISSGRHLFSPFLYFLTLPAYITRGAPLQA